MNAGFDMARIRTIKPEFWTDEKVVELTAFARLLFIGIWNFVDDAGRMPFSIKRMKMQIFPGDDIDCAALADELLRYNLIAKYSVDGVNYMEVCGFAKHQKIDRRTPSKCPAAEDTLSPRRGLDERSMNSPELPRSPPIFPDGREWTKEGKGMDQVMDQVKDQGELPTTTDVVVVGSAADARLAKVTKLCPHQKIIDLYHDILPMCPRVREWTPARAIHLRARWNEDEARQNLEYWRRFFEYVKTCPFLVGQVYAERKRPFFADLEWLTKLANFTKVREERYES